MWLDSKGWAQRAATGAYVPEDVQVLLREIEQLKTALKEIARLGKTTGYGRAALGTIARRALADMS